MLHCIVYTLCINLSVACLSLRGDDWDDFYFCTGTACRTRATVGLAKQFGTPLQALQYFQKPIEDRPEKPSSVRLHRRAVSTQTMPDSDPLETCLLTLPESERLPALTKLLQVVSARSSTDVPVTIPDDFLTLTLRQVYTICVCIVHELKSVFLLDGGFERGQACSSRCLVVG